MSKKKKKVRSHKPRQARIIHARRRANQRFNLDLTTDDILEITRMIQDGESEFIEAQSNVRTKHLVKYNGEEMVVIYHKENKVPVTILFKEEDYYNL